MVVGASQVRISGAGQREDPDQGHPWEAAGWSAPLGVAQGFSLLAGSGPLSQLDREWGPRGTTGHGMGGVWHKMRTQGPSFKKVSVKTATPA